MFYPFVKITADMINLPAVNIKAEGNPLPAICVKAFIIQTSPVTNELGLSLRAKPGV
jgi:hypothetical protein